ncbi:MAG: DNA-binding response regulator [Actinomycetales bacterium]
MIRVLLAEDVHMVRGALVALLDLEDDIEVVATSSDGTDVLELVQAHTPDVAVLDIDLAGADGIDLARAIQEDHPGVRVLLLTSMSTPATVQRALSAQVDGFLLKDEQPEQLAQAVRDIARGRKVVDGDLVLNAMSVGPCPLSPRELEVLRAAADGQEPGEIAKKLFLSIGTVRNHLTAAMAKLSARNRVDAVRKATDSGWI